MNLEYSVIQVQVYSPNELVQKAFTSHDLASGPTNIRREHSSKSMRVLPSSVNLASHSRVTTTTSVTTSVIDTSCIWMAFKCTSSAFVDVGTGLTIIDTDSKGEKFSLSSRTFTCPSADSIGTETIISIAIVTVKSTLISV